MILVRCQVAILHSNLSVMAQNKRSLSTLSNGSASGAAYASTPSSSSSSFDAAVDSFLTAEVSISQLSVSLGQPIESSSNSSTRWVGGVRPVERRITHEQVQRDVAVIQTKLKQLERAINQLRTATLDQPELKEEEQQRKLQIIEKHAGIVEE